MSDTVNKNQLISTDLKRLMLCLVADEYDPSEAKALVEFRGDEFRQRTQDELREVIAQQLWSQEYFSRLTGFDFRDGKSFYSYLSEFYNFVFSDAAAPQIEKYWV